MALIPRTLLQLLFLTATLTVLAYHLRQRQRMIRASGTTTTHDHSTRPAAITRN